jgi:hypothetical protein
MRARALAVLAAIAVDAGSIADALAWSEEGVRIVDALGGVDEGEMTLWLARARALEASGAHDAARDTIARAHTRLLAIASPITGVAERQAFLRAVDEHAQIEDLARAWGVATS